FRRPRAAAVERPLEHQHGAAVIASVVVLDVLADAVLARSMVVQHGNLAAAEIENAALPRMTAVRGFVAVQLNVNNIGYGGRRPRTARKGERPQQQIPSRNFWVIHRAS